MRSQIGISTALAVGVMLLAPLRFALCGPKWKVPYTIDGKEQFVDVTTVCYLNKPPGTNFLTCDPPRGGTRNPHNGFELLEMSKFTFKVTPIQKSDKKMNPKLVATVISGSEMLSTKTDTTFLADGKRFIFQLGKENKGPYDDSVAKYTLEKLPFKKLDYTGKAEKSTIENLSFDATVGLPYFAKVYDMTYDNNKDMFVANPSRTTAKSINDRKLDGIVVYLKKNGTPYADIIKENLANTAVAYLIPGDLTKFDKGRRAFGYGLRMIVIKTPRINVENIRVVNSSPDQTPDLLARSSRTPTRTAPLPSIPSSRSLTPSGASSAASRSPSITRRARTAPLPPTPSSRSLTPSGASSAASRSPSITRRARTAPLPPTPSSRSLSPARRDRSVSPSARNPIGNRVAALNPEEDENAFKNLEIPPCGDISENANQQKLMNEIHVPRLVNDKRSAELLVKAMQSAGVKVVAFDFDHTISGQNQPNGVVKEDERFEQRLTDGAVLLINACYEGGLPVWVASNQDNHPYNDDAEKHLQYAPPPQISDDPLIITVPSSDESKSVDAECYWPTRIVPWEEQQGMQSGTGKNRNQKPIRGAPFIARVFVNSDVNLNQKNKLKIITFIPSAMRPGSTRDNVGKGRATQRKKLIHLQEIARREGVEHHQVVLFDDNPDNYKSAAACGFLAIKVPKTEPYGIQLNSITGDLEG